LQPEPQSEILLQLVRTRMPFGKYKEVLLCDLPITYLEWFNRKGFPAGKLGMQLATMYEIQLNGLTDLLEPIKKAGFAAGNGKIPYKG
jgi:uncharacterized protein (DUF3820 family)